MDDSVAVVLAAGGGSRFAGARPKLLTVVQGRPLVVRAIEAAVAADLVHTVVVTGAIDLAEVVPPGVVTVANERWADGIATSLRTAIDHVRTTWPEIDAVVVGLGDQPGVPMDAWRTVARARATPIAVATYDGARRNPVRLHRDVWDLLPDEGDDGARLVMRAHPELVAEVSCAGRGDDIDTIEDLERWA